MTTDFDPEATFSGNLPSLPPPPPRDTGGELTPLDPRFPMPLDEPAHIFWQLTSEWGDRETVIDQTIRATQQHAVREVRFVQPLHQTLPIPAITAPVVHHETAPVIYEPLTETALKDDWDTGPGVAIATVERAPRRRRLPPRGPGGRWIARKATGGA
jgi:hypothetical protein